MNAAEVFKALGTEADKLVKDIPVDHIIRGVQVYSRALYIRYFKGYRTQTATKRVRLMVDREILEKGNEELAQLLSTLWNRAKGRLYHSTYNLIRSVNENVEEIDLIEDEQAAGFLDELLEEFHPAEIFLCIVFNEVRFSKAVIEEKLKRTMPFDSWPPEKEKEEEYNEAQLVL